MKTKIITLVCFLCLTSFSAFSQGSFPFKNLKLKKIGTSVGVEQDMFIGDQMSHSYFNNLSDDPTLKTSIEDRVNSYFSKTSGVCENPHIRLNMVYELPKNDNELHLNLIGVFNRVDGVYYSTNNYNDVDYKSFNYDLYSHEIALGASYVAKQKLSVLPNLFDVNLYGMLGTNIGYQFMNDLNVSGTEEITENKLGTRPDVGEIASDYTYADREYFHNYYDVSDAINQRVYAGAGFGLVFLNRLEIGAAGRYGLGYRYHFSDEVIGTNLRSFELNAKWILK